MITIQGEIHSSKNSRVTDTRTGRTYKSKAAKADEKMLALQLNTQRAVWEMMIRGRKYPFHVVFRFTRRTLAKWDFANIVQGVADAMVKAGYIHDDNVDYFIPVWGGYGVDKENPGVEFWIE